MLPSTAYSSLFPKLRNMELLLNALTAMLLPSFSQRREKRSSRVTKSRETMGTRRLQIDNVSGRRENAFPPPLWVERRH